MSKIRIILYSLIVFAVAAASIAAPAALAAETSVQTLASNGVSVTGTFEEGATLTVSTTTYSEKAEKELIERKLITRSEQIVAIYDITASGEQTGVYSVTVSDIKLNVLFKNKIAVIDSNGAFYAIKSNKYSHKAVTFQTDTLGQVVIYKDGRLFYLSIGIASGLVVLIIAIKIIDAKRFKKEKNAPSHPKNVREHDKTYKW